MDVSIGDCRADRGEGATIRYYEQVGLLTAPFALSANSGATARPTSRV